MERYISTTPTDIEKKVQHTLDVVTTRLQHLERYGDGSAGLAQRLTKLEESAQELLKRNEELEARSAGLEEILTQHSELLDDVVDKVSPLTEKGQRDWAIFFKTPAQVEAMINTPSTTECFSFVREVASSSSTDVPLERVVRSPPLVSQNEEPDPTHAKAVLNKHLSTVEWAWTSACRQKDIVFGGNDDHSDEKKVFYRLDVDHRMSFIFALFHALRLPELQKMHEKLEAAFYDLGTGEEITVSKAIAFHYALCEAMKALDVSELSVHPPPSEAFIHKQVNAVYVAFFTWLKQYALHIKRDSSDTLPKEAIDSLQHIVYYDIFIAIATIRLFLHANKDYLWGPRCDLLMYLTELTQKTVITYKLVSSVTVKVLKICRDLQRAFETNLFVHGDPHDFVLHHLKTGEIEIADLCFQFCRGWECYSLKWTEYPDLSKLENYLYVEKRRNRVHLTECWRMSVWVLVNKDYTKFLDEIKAELARHADDVDANNVSVALQTEDKDRIVKAARVLYNKCKAEHFNFTPLLPVKLTDSRVNNRVKAIKYCLEKYVASLKTPDQVADWRGFIGCALKGLLFEHSDVKYARFFLDWFSNTTDDQLSTFSRAFHEAYVCDNVEVAKDDQKAVAEIEQINEKMMATLKFSAKVTKTYVKINSVEQFNTLIQYIQTQVTCASVYDPEWDATKFFSERLYQLSMDSTKTMLTHAEFFKFLGAVYSAQAFIRTVMGTGKHTPQSVARHHLVKFWESERQKNKEKLLFAQTGAALNSLLLKYLGYTEEHFKPYNNCMCEITQEDVQKILKFLTEEGDYSLLDHYLVLLTTAFQVTMATDRKFFQKLAIAKAYLGAVRSRLINHPVDKHLLPVAQMFQDHDDKNSGFTATEKGILGAAITALKGYITPDYVASQAYGVECPLEGEHVSNATTTMRDLIVSLISGAVMGVERSANIRYFGNNGAKLRTLTTQLRNCFAAIEVDVPRFCSDYLCSFGEQVMGKLKIPQRGDFKVTPERIQGVLNGINTLKRMLLERHHRRAVSMKDIQHEMAKTAWTWVYERPARITHDAYVNLSQFKVLKMCCMHCDPVFVDKFERFCCTINCSDIMTIRIGKNAAQRWMDYLRDYKAIQPDLFYHQVSVIADTVQMNAPLLASISSTTHPLPQRLLDFLEIAVSNTTDEKEYGIINELREWIRKAKFLGDAKHVLPEIARVVASLRSLIPAQLEYKMNQDWVQYASCEASKNFTELLRTLMNGRYIHEKHAFSYNDDQVRTLRANRFMHNIYLSQLYLTVPGLTQNGAMALSEQAWGRLEINANLCGLVVDRRKFYQFLDEMFRVYYVMIVIEGKETLTQFMARKQRALWSDAPNPMPYGMFIAFSLLPHFTSCADPFKVYQKKEALYRNGIYSNEVFNIHHPKDLFDAWMTCLDVLKTEPVVTEHKDKIVSLLDCLVTILHDVMVMGDKLVYGAIATTYLQAYASHFSEYAAHWYPSKQCDFFPKEWQTSGCIETTARELIIVFNAILAFDCVVVFEPAKTRILERFCRITQYNDKYQRSWWLPVTKLYFNILDDEKINNGNFTPETLCHYVGSLLAPPLDSVVCQDDGTLAMVPSEAKNLPNQGVGVTRFIKCSISTTDDGATRYTFDNAELAQIRGGTPFEVDPRTRVTFETIHDNDKVAKNLLNQGTGTSGMSTSITALTDDTPTIHTLSVPERVTVCHTPVDPNLNNPYPGREPREHSFFDRFEEMQRRNPTFARIFLAAINAGEDDKASSEDDSSPPDLEDENGVIERFNGDSEDFANAQLAKLQRKPAPTKRTVDQLSNAPIMWSPAASSSTPSNDVISKLTGEISEIKTMLKALTDRMVKVEQDIDPIPDLVNRMAQAEDNHSMLQTRVEDIDGDMAQNSADITILDEIVTEMNAKLPELEKTIAALGTARPSGEPEQETHIQKKARRCMEEE